MPTATLDLTRPLDLPLTLGPLARPGGDPTVKIAEHEAWRATRTPAGPATLHIRKVGACVDLEAWGSGAGWALEHAASLLGEEDDPAAFVPRHEVLADLHRRLPGLRIPRSLAVYEALVPIILEQKVPGIQAFSAYRRLVRMLGEPAPGPSRLILPPSPEALAAVPYWTLHRIGVERRRAETLNRVARLARRLDEAAWLPAPEAAARLGAVPGVGPWTIGKVGLMALGDPDAVPVGDYHLPHLVSWALEGRARGTDERMLELLAPYSGQRGRALALLQASGTHAPRFGPRMALREIEKT